MKKSRIAKFALLGASTAALAATLTTSTYAWYVSNKTATVATSTGNSASAASDGSISLSTTGDYGTFFKNIDLGSFTSAEGLVPVNTTDGMTFTKLGSVSGTTVSDTSASIGTVSGSGCSTAANVYHYVFYILADSDVTVTPTITVANVTDSYTSQVNYGTTTIGSNVSQGQAFNVNALNALTLTSRQTASTTTYGSSFTWASATKDTATAVKGAQLSEGMTQGIVRTTTKTSTGTAVATEGAIDYYEEITGNELSTAQKTQYTPTAIGAFDVDENKPQMLEFWLFLDGADDVCFNACEQQDFEVSFSFTAAARS